MSQDLLGVERLTGTKLGICAVKMWFGKVLGMLRVSMMMSDEESVEDSESREDDNDDDDGDDEDDEDDCEDDDSDE